MTDIAREIGQPRRRGTPLSHPERLQVATLMHELLFSEITRALTIRPGQLIMQGGGALHYGYGSPRLSNDVDFLIAEAEAETLGRAGQRIARRVTASLRAQISGSQVSFRCGNGDPRVSGSDQIQSTIDIVWEHARRDGQVRVAAEFHPVPASITRAYRQDPVMLKLSVLPGGGMIPLLLGAPVGLWGDKVKAIACRQDLKWRDLFDLGFLSEHRGVVDASVHDRLRAIDVATRLHRGSLLTVYRGLESRIADIGGVDGYGRYMSDLERWFAPDMFAAFDGTGSFRAHFDRAQADLAHAHDIIAYYFAHGDGVRTAWEVTAEMRGGEIERLPSGDYGWCTAAAERQGFTSAAAAARDCCEASGWTELPGVGDAERRGDHVLEAGL